MLILELFAWLDITISLVAGLIINWGLGKLGDDLELNMSSAEKAVTKACAIFLMANALILTLITMLN